MLFITRRAKAQAMLCLMFQGTNQINYKPSKHKNQEQKTCPALISAQSSTSESISHLSLNNIVTRKVRKAIFCF